jgi:hypothetical protein
VIEKDSLIHLEISHELVATAEVPNKRATVLFKFIKCGEDDNSRVGESLDCGT